MFDMDALAAQVKARRGDECRDVRGVYRVSPEVADWHNELAAMKADGVAIEQIKAVLEPKRQALRAAGHNV